jgi:hypothetical protein
MLQLRCALGASTRLPRLNDTAEHDTDERAPELRAHQSRKWSDHENHSPVLATSCDAIVLRRGAKDEDAVLLIMGEGLATSIAAEEK